MIRACTAGNEYPRFLRDKKKNTKINKNLEEIKNIAVPSIIKKYRFGFSAFADSCLLV